MLSLKKKKQVLLFAVLILLTAFMLPPSAHANIDTKNTVQFPMLSMRDGSLSALSITETNPGSLTAGQEIKFTLINANLDGVVWNICPGEKPEGTAGAWIYAPPTVGGDKNRIKGLTIISQTPDSVTIHTDSVQAGDRGYLSIFVNRDGSDKNASLRRRGSVKLLISPPPGTGFIESETVGAQKYNSPAPAVQGQNVVPEASATNLGTVPVNMAVYGSPIWPKLSYDSSNTGRSPYSVDLTGNIKWIFDDPANTVWSFKFGPLVGTDGTIYYAGELAEKNTANNRYLGAVVAVNPDGTFKWRYQLGAGGASLYNNEIGMDSNGSIYINCRVYTGPYTYNDKIFAINPDGTEKWSITRDPNTNGQVWGPPVFDSAGRVIFGTWKRVEAYDPSNGNLLWSNPLSDGYVPDIYLACQDNIVYVRGYSKYPNYYSRWYLLDSTNGNILHTYDWPNDWGTDDRYGPTITPEGYIIQPIYRKGFACWNPDGSIKWFCDVRDIYVYAEFLGNGVLSPDGSTYFNADYNNYLYSVDIATGACNWAVRYDTAMGVTALYGASENSLSIDTNGDIIVVASSYNSDPYARAGVFSSVDGSIIKAVALQNPNYPDQTTDCYTTGAIGADGTVYLADDTRGWLFALESGSGIDKSTLGKRPYCLYGKGSVNLSTGNYIQEETDLTVPSIGPSLEFTRFYNSTDTYEGPQGKGWTHNYNTHLTVNSDQSINVAYADGQELLFTYNGSSYDRPAGCFEILEAGSDNTYVLTFKDQTEYTYNSVGQLTSIMDKNSNTLTLSYTNGLLNTATEPAGRSLTFSYNADSLISGIVDSAGRSVSYTYDNGQLGTVQDVRGEIIQYQYDEQGLTTIITPDSRTLLHNGYDSGSRVTNQTDGSGNTTQFNYDQANQTTMTDPLGNTIVTAYDEKYCSTGVTYPENITETFAYNDNYCRTGVTDALNHTTAYEYDDFGNLHKITDTAGHVTQMDYDSKNNLLWIENDNGKRITFTYDPDSINLTGVTDPLGNTTSYTYDSSGFLLSKTTPTPDPGTTSYTYQDGLLQTVTDAVYHTTTFDYDNFGNLHTATDAAGKITTMNYNTAGNLTSILDPLGNTTSFTYDWRGNILTKTDARGYITSYAYNGVGILDNIVDDLNNKTQFNYDADNRLEKITDARGNTTTYSYDALGRLTGVTDPLGYTTNSQYDATGNLTGKTDALGREVLSASYNELNYPTTVTNALGKSIVNEYDSLSRLTSVTDPMSRVTQFDYDDLNRLTSTTDAVYGQGSQGFDAHGNRISLTDPNSNTIGFGYDSADRLRSKTTASAGASALEYNNRNLLAQKTNARGQITTYQYDDAGRLVSSTNPNGTTSYTYDQNGNVLTATDSNGTIEREYDALNRVSKYTDTHGNIIQYGYDAVGNLVTLTYPGGRQVQYGYDVANRLVKVTDWASRITTYEYDPNGRLAKTIRPDGTVETRTYNAAGRLTQLKDTGTGGSVLSQFDYEYDAKGNIINDNNTNESEPFTTNSAALTYAADNRLATYEGQAVLYDADGNMTEGPLAGNMVNFTFDARSRLTGAGNTSYTYEAGNKRIRVSNGVHQTSYVINPNAPLSQVLIETDEQSNQTFYVYGLGLIGQESPGGTYRNYHFDHLGSTIALTDNSGLVTDRFRYAPYGELVYRSGNTATPFLFSGRHGVMTDASDLYYMRARYYNPVAKRFLSPDTLTGQVSNPQSQNRYIYCQGNPVNYVDPTGHIASSEVRTAIFVLWHPVAANQIGFVDPGKGKTDITNDAVRFSTNDLGLNENSSNEGSQINAFRHALWQATITKTLIDGEKLATEIGYAHEENPNAIDGIQDFSGIRFSTLSEADESIDLLNNVIGREIGNNVNSLMMNDIAKATLNYYYEKGLWVAKEQSDGTYEIVQEKLSDEQYQAAYDRLNGLDFNGFTKEQGEKVYDAYDYK